jgi:hypothetical protein
MIGNIAPIISANAVMTCAARHRAAPAGVHETKDGGDQRAGVADTDPEHEIRDVEGPVDRVVDPGHAEAHVHLVAPRAEPHEDDGAEEGDDQIETPRRFQQRAKQIVAELAGVGFAHTCVCRAR